MKFAGIIPLVFLCLVKLEIRIKVAAGVERTQLEHGLGSRQRPASACDIEPVVNQVATGSFDDPGGDWESACEIPGRIAAWICT